MQFNVCLKLQTARYKTCVNVNFQDDRMKFQTACCLTRDRAPLQCPKFAIFLREKSPFLKLRRLSVAYC